MDALAALLDGPRAREAFLVRASMARPWSMHVVDEAPLTVICLLRGGACIVPDGGDPVPLEPGDVAVARGPDHYVVADEPGTAPTIRIEAGARCVSLDGQRLERALAQGIRTWGTSPDGPDLMLIGTYDLRGSTDGRLLAALPPLVTVPSDELDGPLLHILDAEMQREGEGQTAVLDRLLDLVLIATLRCWFARPESDAPGWYRAESDPIVGAALRLLHHNPAHPWTVAALAREVGVSRAALARRFTELVGEPPMTHLTDWRIALAADRLREPGVKLDAIARDVGYASPFALSVAFKRVTGVSPTEYKRAGAV